MDLFSRQRPAEKPAPPRADLAIWAVRDLRGPRAHACFRCGRFTPPGVQKREWGGVVFACSDHIGEVK